VRDEEKNGVIAKIKEAIQVYGITSQELFGVGQSNVKKFQTKSKFGQAAKFADRKGNTWVGRGPRPEWLREALAAGKSLEDFSVAGAKPNGTLNAAVPAGKAAANRARATTARNKKTGRPVKKVLPPKFKDDAGNSWTGRGSQPRWLRDAVAAGKKLVQLRA